ncbi:hypothetical protein HMPREF0262_00408 [Clostridium sp. ATCC 29733]|nr:hypothetical protein HMPREF0262_00408 [Clostridium sp. ATCC 29733]
MTAPGPLGPGRPALPGTGPLSSASPHSAAICCPGHADRAGQ